MKQGRTATFQGKFTDIRRVMNKLIKIFALLAVYFIVYEDTQFRTVPCGDWIKQESSSTKEKNVSITAACMEKTEFTYRSGPFRSKIQAEQVKLPFLKSRIEEVKK